MQVLQTTSNTSYIYFWKVEGPVGILRVFSDWAPQCCCNMKRLPQFPGQVFRFSLRRTYFPWRLASIISFLKSSFRSFILFRFSRRSSSARSLTYLSNTCFLSFDVSRRYRGSKTILWSSFSQVENAETLNRIFWIVQYRIGKNFLRIETHSETVKNSVC